MSTVVYTYSCRHYDVESVIEQKARRQFRLSPSSAWLTGMTQYNWFITRRFAWGKGMKFTMNKTDLQILISTFNPPYKSLTIILYILFRVSRINRDNVILLYWFSPSLTYLSQQQLRLSHGHDLIHTKLLILLGHGFPLT